MEFKGCVRVEPTSDNRWTWCHHKTELPSFGSTETETKFETQKEAVDAARAYIEERQKEQILH